MKVLETERLILRYMEPSDYDSLKDIICDPETMKYYPFPYDEKGVYRWIDWNLNLYRDFGFGLYSITLKENGLMIGDCGLTIQNINGVLRPEIGYHINKKYWRFGYAKEAGTAVRDYIFEHTTFKTLYSYMNKENIPSVKTCKSLGMSYEFTYKDDKETLEVYSISKEQWEIIK